LSSSDEENKFKSFYEKCKHLVVLSGAGVSAESGIPTFRGEGGYWRNYNAQVNQTSFQTINKKKLHLSIARKSSKLREKSSL
jgi:NAD-dependent SIR2 family protein deacetylase